MESTASRVAEVKGEQGHCGKERCGGSCFQMPLHYPRFTRAQYEAMPEWELDCLLKSYGLTVAGDVHEKRSYAIESVKIKQTAKALKETHDGTRGVLQLGPKLQERTITGQR